MSVNGQMTYAQLFSTVRNGPYRFRVFVKLPTRATEIEFAVSAWSPASRNPLTRLHAMWSDSNFQLIEDSPVFAKVMTTSLWDLKSSEILVEGRP